MANKRYGEDEGSAALPEKVKGDKDTKGAAYKDYSAPDGAGDDARWPGFGEVKPVASVPADHEPKKLPKAGGLA